MEQRKPKTATGPELAEILGVSHQAIYKAVKTGRLSKCVSGTARSDRTFEIYTAVLEWENGRDNSQVRDQKLTAHAPLGSTFPPVAESRQAYEYYQAINEQIEALKQAGKLVDLAVAQNEVFLSARIMRDRLGEIPEKMRFSILSFGLSDADTNELIKLLQEEIYQGLLHLSELDMGRLKEELTASVQKVAEGVPGVTDAGA
ncbi:MAG: hypothetical protein M3Q07_01955 [Pseudobdellovibrionaceae bacterium]|nr:hypothetical protein [Pseudobdellovibrionaceae bacterium]